jgi:hypothetical protein
MILIPKIQCCGSGMFIPDPESRILGPDFYPFRIPDLGSWIPYPKTATKERGKKKNLLSNLFLYPQTSQN